MLFETPTPDDHATILADHERFWGDRDLRSLHHPMYCRQLADTGLIARGDGILGYLFGFVAPTGEGYVHLVAVRDDARGTGLGRLLYERFAELAADRGADRLTAITTPANTSSIAFHRALGFTAETVADYAGPGADRVLLRRPLDPARYAAGRGEDGAGQPAPGYRTARHGEDRSGHRLPDPGAGPEAVPVAGAGAVPGAGREGGPGRDTAVRIEPAVAADAGAVLTVQRAAFVTEALAYGAAIPPVRETVADVAAAIGAGAVLVARDGTRIVGAVRVTARGADAEIGRLAVAPDRQGEGLGSRLLAAAEAHAGPARRYVLVAGHRSDRNLDMYRRRGYAETHRTLDPVGVPVVQLAKPRHTG